LRQEARPIPYWQHHKRAKEALDFIIKGLDAAINSLDAVKVDKDKSSVDTNRASRIIFVSGEPGSGKSSLYLTLKEMLSSPPKEEYRVGKTVPDALKNVRWLDALDLEVASEEGENLLAAVLVRLIKELTREDRVSNTIYSQPCDDAIKKLEELATDIGIAWEGNLRARGGALDPDTYSEEVMRAQRARLGINDRLKDALNELAKSRCYGCDEKTLFLLPVDDLYLKPDVSLQLLRLLRMISIPRLFFLIMGDITTVEALFIEKSLADWTEVAGTRLFASRSERLDSAITRARELRARYLRKLLPPLQRAEIEPMDWHEALDFETGRPGDSDDTIEELLANVNLDRQLGKKEEDVNLLKFLISPPLPDKKKERADERVKRIERAKSGKDAEEESGKEGDLKAVRSAYTALQILDATPREMMDLGAALREAKVKKPADEVTPPPPLLTIVRDIVNIVRDEQNFLSEKEQKVLEGVLPTRHYGYSEDIIFEMDRLSLCPSPRSWSPKLESQRIWVRGHHSWNLTINEKNLEDSKNEKNLEDSKNARTEQEENKSRDENRCTEQAAKNPYAKLPPRPAAWFVLLHDLAWRWKHNSINENLVKKLCESLNDWRLRDNGITSPPDVNTGSQSKPKPRFTIEQKISPDRDKYPEPSDWFVGWAVYSPDGSTYEHFPMPDFETFRDLDRFLFIWSRGLKALSNCYEDKDKVGKLFELWELAGRTIFLDIRKDRSKNEGIDAYENLAKRIAEGKDAWCGEELSQLLRELRNKSLSSPPDEDETNLNDWVRKLKTDEEVSQWSCPPSSSPPA
jgi:hypothetical protein